ncbi:MAG: hypothetical protein ACRC33_11425 [Gemmataceae bacterium]
MLQGINRFLTRCPLHLREMGFVRELWGIRGRYLQFREQWDEHCRRARAAVLDAAGRCPQRRTAVVFGSGWLHDVPVVELAGMFKKVLLVDLMHPFSVRWFLGRHRNVEAIDADVSAVLEPAWAAVEKREAVLPVSRPDLFLGADGIDLVVSLNLLSQLPCMPSWYLKKHGSYPEGLVEAFNRQVVEAHLDYLTRLPGVVCLICDVEIITRTPTRAEVARRSTLYGASLPWPAQQEWEWALVPRGDREPYHGQYLRVVAVPDINRRGRPPAIPAA